jgi:gamma-glutamyltranspeptidase / glutathione hydrolase
VTTRVAVAAPSTFGTDAALRVVADGGTAVDAAVAAVLATLVTEPGIVSLAGGAFATVWPAGEPDAVTVDGCLAMPGLGPAPAAVPVLRDVRTDYGGGVTMIAGHGSVAVPGALAALALTHERWGALPWREVVAPAAEVARAGFPMGSAAGYYLRYVRETLYGWDPETLAALQDGDGRWLDTGDHVMVAGLAGTLELIADEGAQTLYTGDLAAAIVDDMAQRGGLVGAADLAGYRPLVRPALAVSSAGWQLRTNPPPAIGGAVLAAMLHLIGDLPRADWTEQDVGRLIAVQRQVLDARRDRVDVAEDRARAAWQLLFDAGLTAAGSSSTAHVSVVDADGTACAVTTSFGYGSGATVPGTGIWLNNGLGEQELNRAGGLAPGARLASNMAPTVGRHPGGAALAIGSPGADRITTALLQVLAAFTNGRAPLQSAVDRPRLHVHHLDAGDPDGAARIEAEEDLPLPVLDLPVRRHHAHSMYFGGVAAALRRSDGTLEAAGDPRRAGAVAVSD